MKKFIIAGILLLLVALAAWTAAAHYQQLLAARLRIAAESARSDKRYTEAERFYRLAFQRAPNSLSLLHSYAGFLDETHRPGGMDVQLRIIQLDPADTVAKLDAAEEALQFRKLTLARRLLFPPTPEMKKIPRYDDLVGWLAMISGDLANADAVWANALESRPGNKIHESNLAMVRLSSTDEAVRAEALKQLERIVFAEKPPMSALSSLMVYASRNATEPADLDRWLARVSSLIAPRDRFFTSYLEALRRWRPDRFREELTAYLKQAAAQPTMARAAQNWMATTGLYDDFVAFRSALPPPLRDDLLSAMLAADVFFALKRNSELDQVLQLPAWKSVTPLKKAWQERIRRASQPAADTADLQKWNEILETAGRSDLLLGRLSEMAFTWGWKTEYATSLWTIVERSPLVAPDALENLFQFYLRTQDSANLRKVAARQLTLVANDPNIQNNYAFLSFLLGHEPEKAMKVSADLCAKYPQTPRYIATYAFGLLKAGQPKEGMRLFRGLDIRRLKGTAPGVCYGLLLAATGERGALAYLDQAERWVYLPEELRMVTEARAAFAQ